MPSIDVVSRINFAELDNAINNTLKAVAARFDFRNSPVEITVDRKEKKIKMTAADDGKMKGLQEMFTHAAIKRGLEMKSFDFSDIEQGRHGESKREIKLREGLTSENAKAISKLVKESKLKVQASIQGEEVRLTSKSIDEIRTVMAMLDKAGLEQPLQYVNMKS
jgi:uncharacterized protein YajQ (UPF0234 family)